ncbi:uncharacterized protein LOC130784002 isoform X2 [Actinidia eriantha]|uniref:uncharacterized protein LOC130784002 isoform X2 n=1 Tax=Actinidia eriantha TaxID=165200 RepID=UPI0025844F88|nr:uncharacterized protein LOC130784002 isoform X2 [Actinidia eriantha]
MASVPHSSWFCTLKPTDGYLSSSKPKPRNSQLKTLKISSLSSNNAESSSLNSSNSPENSSEPSKIDPVKLAFAKAKAYKEAIRSNPVPKIVQNRVPESAETGNKIDGSVSDVISNEKAKEYKKNKETIVGNRGIGEKGAEVLGNKIGESVPVVTNNGGNEEIPFSVRLAMEKAKEYKKTKETIAGSSGIGEKSETFFGAKNDGSVSDVTTGGNQEAPTSVELAMEKAKEYQKNKGVVGSRKSVEESQVISGLKGGNGMNSRNLLFEKMAAKEEELKISSVDFMGVDFVNKKGGRGLQAGTVPVADPFPEGYVREVEILIGDASKFGNAMVSKPKSTEEDSPDMYKPKVSSWGSGNATVSKPKSTEEDSPDIYKPKVSSWGSGNATVSKPKSTEEDSPNIYKPKVSSWGVFPRPSNISKTYGGGRVIRPGQVLETAEVKAAKEARTRELVAAYRSKNVINIDPKLKSECEKVLKDGDSLMELGKLKEALPFYENIMDKLPFKSELHGLAALQWSICQDSLCRREEARVMYEKLQSHPNAKVSKNAKNLLFGFEAMEMMKVKNSATDLGYQKYFEAFVEDKASYPLKDDEVEEDALSQALPYIIFLFSPILFVLLIAVQKGS